MQLAKITQLFLLFAGLPRIAGYEDYVQAAAGQVQSELRADADAGDIRLCYYAAALANLQYRTVASAGNAFTPTYAGDLDRRCTESYPCDLAERLVREYRKACLPLLRDDCAFVFRNIGGGMTDDA